MRKNKHLLRLSSRLCLRSLVQITLVFICNISAQSFPYDTTACISPVSCAPPGLDTMLRLPEYGVSLRPVWTSPTICPQPFDFFLLHDVLYPDPPPAESLPFQAGLVKVWQEEDRRHLGSRLIDGNRRCGIPYERIHDDTFWVEGPTFRYTDLEYRIFEHDLNVDTIYMAVRNITLDSLWLRFDTTSFFGDTGVWVSTMDRPKRSRPGPMLRCPAKVLAVHGGRRPAGPYGVFDIRGREVRVRRSGGLVIVR